MIVLARHCLRASPKKGINIHALFATLLAALPAVAGDGPATWLGLPAVIVPADNPITPAKVELGKKLFMDRRLSPNGTMSCAMCHVPEQGFTVNELATPIGFEGKSLRRNAPTLLNVALQASFLRDGSKPTLEAQVWGPMLAPNEMANRSVDAVVARINGLADYRDLFALAFDGKRPCEVTIAQAIASYERTLLAGNSRFDRWYFGKQTLVPFSGDVLTAQEQVGFAVFISSGCDVCHTLDENVAMFSDGLFHNTGAQRLKQQQASQTISVQLAPGVNVKIDPRELATVSEPEQSDDGRFEVSKNPEDRHAFKTPSLRNVALTAPYMHDGSLATLDDVIDFYSLDNAIDSDRSKLLKPTNFSMEEKRNLTAFLKSLTSDNVSELSRAARAAFHPFPNDGDGQ